MPEGDWTIPLISFAGLALLLGPAFAYGWYRRRHGLDPPYVEPEPEPPAPRPIPIPKPPPNKITCPFCGHVGHPTQRSVVTTGGWLFFLLTGVSCIGLLICWLGLLMREQQSFCAGCTVRLG